MTKTIEFIDKEIEFLKKQIVKYENYLLAFSQVSVENRLEEMKENLQTLEQIKNELEAWEVVKEELQYQETIHCEERPEYTYEFKKWSFEINENDYGFEEKSIKLKKALEAKNE